MNSQKENVTEMQYKIEAKDFDGVGVLELSIAMKPQVFAASLHSDIVNTKNATLLQILGVLSGHPFKTLKN